MNLLPMCLPITNLNAWRLPLLGEKYPIDEATIRCVTSLPIQGKDLEKYLTSKDASQQEIYGTYSTCQGRHGILIS
jgi:hypothetical protein